MATKLSPQGVFAIVGILPKALQEDFRNTTYTEVKQESTDFDPDPEKRYDHSLGLSWLSGKGIPNTTEGLDEQREYVFKTMISGPVNYNVGQFIVLFPEAVYSASDIEDAILVVEVMDELEFPPEVDLLARHGDSVITTETNFSTTALQAALMSYLPQGKVKVHPAGMRMYHMSKQYQFEAKFIDADEKTLNFKDAVRRQRNG